MRTRKYLALLLSLLMLFFTGAGVLATGFAEDLPEPLEALAGHYTYRTSMSTLPSGWNPHTYQTADDAVYFDFTTSGLYTLYFNDELHPHADKTREPFSSYVIVPEMAAAYPVDVTEEVKVSHPQFNIPEDATSGYAWSVRLRDDLKWQDGTPITAQDFVDSLERLLRPELQNYRAADYFRGSYALANAERYALSGNPVYTSFAEQGTSYEAFIAGGGSDEEVAIDMMGFWNVSGPDGIHSWGRITDDTMVTYPGGEEGVEYQVSAKYLWDNYLGSNGDYAASGYELGVRGHHQLSLRGGLQL